MAKIERIVGVLAPVITPFRKDYAPDAERFVRHCRWLLKSGCSGLAVFGTNSEANSLSANERMALLEALVNADVDPKRMMPGTGCCALSDSIAVMRGGKIIEVGTPQKIYFDADHRFVADFIGRANLVKAVVIAQENGHTIVESGLGTLACQHRDFEIGTEVTLCLRPEFITIVRGETASAPNVVNGRVDSLVFVGEAYEAEIRAGNELLLAKTHADVPLKQGEPVSFSLDPEHCLLVAV